jgi:hypothetical protein
VGQAGSLRPIGNRPFRLKNDTRSMIANGGAGCPASPLAEDASRKKNEIKDE